MKKLVIIATVISIFGSVVFAGNSRIQATVVDMKETYTDVIKNVPENVCSIVEVPVYEERQVGGASSGDVLAGAIIGGVIGNQFGNGKGKDAMTVLGAIVGADSVNKNGRKETVIVGYRQQEQCTTEYVRQVVSVRGDNVVTVETDDGQRFQFNTKSWYKRGTIVFLNVSM